MSNTLMVLLIGGRIQPSILLTLNQQPDVVAILASRDSRGSAVYAQNLLTKLLPNSKILEPRFVSPYQPSQTSAEIDGFLAEYPGTRAAVSLTGAPMPMGVGAVESAKRHGLPAYYFNTLGGEVIDLVSEQTSSAIQLKVNVEQLLDTYDLKIAPRQKPLPNYLTTPEQRQGMVDLFVAQPRAASELLDWVRRKADLLQIRTIRKKWRDEFGDAHWTLMESLHEHGILVELDRSRANQVSFQLAGSGEAHYLAGQWLEEYVYQSAEQAQIEGQPAFDSFRWRLQVLSGGAEREIDFIGVHRGVALIASAKSGTDRWNKGNVDELAAVANLLGGLYCIQLYVTNAPKPLEGAKDWQSYLAFEEQAKKQKTVVVTGDQLGNLSDLLANQFPRPTFGLR